MIRVLVTCYVRDARTARLHPLRDPDGSPSSEVRGSFTRLTGPFNQSNTFARYLAFLLVFGIAIYPYVKPKLKLPVHGDAGSRVGVHAAHADPNRDSRSVAGVVVIALVQEARASSEVSSRSESPP